MLQKLYIKNYVLIDRLEVDFSDQLTIITGETGAGKSIILGALSLILGQRANTHVLFDKKTKSIVEGTFQIADYQLQAFFEEKELDYEPSSTTIRREITPSGKSRAFINDTPVNLTTLRELSEQLVNLHAQHQTLHLQDASYQLFVIDTLANHFDLLNDYKEAYTAYQKNIRQLKKLKKQYAQLKKDSDYITFLVSEFEEVSLQDPNEQEQLEAELTQLENAEAIKRNLLESSYIIEENDYSILQQLSSIKSLLADISRFSPNIEELLNRLDSVTIELQDLGSELGGLESELLMDPEKAQQIQERLNLIYRLQTKHQVNSIAELIDIEANLQADNQAIFDTEKKIKVLEETLAVQLQKLTAKAQQLSEQRKAQIPDFERRTDNLLTQVGMPNATIKAAHSTLPNNEFSNTGIDNIELLFAANKGSEHTELRKAASGGELSRLMLCIKSLIADNTALPTLIFDEIDTGISGEVALKVGNVMQKLAKAHQVLCITHLPQIASKGSAHYFVYKEIKEDRTFTRVRALNQKDRIREIAKMLSGDKPSQMALANAKELLEV